MNEEKKAEMQDPAARYFDGANFLIPEEEFIEWVRKHMNYQIPRDAFVWAVQPMSNRADWDTGRPLPPKIGVALKWPKK